MMDIAVVLAFLCGSATVLFISACLYRFGYVNTVDHLALFLHRHAVRVRNRHTNEARALHSIWRGEVKRTSRATAQAILPVSVPSALRAPRNGGGVR